jgi:hypothetical protein
MLTTAGMLRQGVVVRTVPWGQVAAVLLLAAAPSVVVAVQGTQRFDGAVLAGLLLAGPVAAFAFDEPARAVADAGPTTMARRVLARLALIVVAVGVWTLVVAALATSGADVVVVARRHSAAACAAASTSLAAAAWARRRGAARVSPGAVVVGPSLVVVSTALAREYRWMPSLLDDDSTRRWWSLVALAALVVVTSMRDPYRRLLPPGR